MDAVCDGPGGICVAHIEHRLPSPRPVEVGHETAPQHFVARLHNDNLPPALGEILSVSPRPWCMSETFDEALFDAPDVPVAGTLEGVSGCPPTQPIEIYLTKEDPSTGASNNRVTSFAPNAGGRWRGEPSGNPADKARLGYRSETFGSP